MIKPLAKTWAVIISTVSFSLVELETLLRLTALAIGIAYSIWTFYRAVTRARREDAAMKAVQPVRIDPEEGD